MTPRKIMLCISSLLTRSIYNLVAMLLIRAGLTIYRFIAAVYRYTKSLLTKSTLKLVIFNQIQKRMKWGGHETHPRLIVYGWPDVMHSLLVLNCIIKAVRMYSKFLLFSFIIFFLVSLIIMYFFVLSFVFYSV